MEKPKSYCEAVSRMEPFSVHRIYHDNNYGFPLHNDNELFGRLVLEINQAGLSWTTILNKQENFKEAYAGFDIPSVAAFGDTDIARLLDNPGIIRNRLKIQAAITNAQKIMDLQNAYGSFQNWLDQHHPLDKPAWIKLFKKTFTFTGGEITNEFLMSAGYLPGAHVPDCPFYEEAIRAGAMWAVKKDH
ncbi:MAG: DNA-3-methyladenine glycosylase I [Bacteroidia bacterium]|nr:DNA-3-methyladenine glycosylase I [Bacteroidia bacterium]